MKAILFCGTTGFALAVACVPLSIQQTHPVVTIVVALASVALSATALIMCGYRVIT